MSNVPIDIEQLSHISGGDSSFESEILLEFCDLTASLIRELEEALLQGDMQLTCSIAHSIKGSARTIGAVQVAGYAEMIELSARMGEATRFEQDLGELMTAFELVEAFVQQRCTSDAA
jgi:HPt (histidine-containing phosphotransfer) domain-containing protein